MSVEILRRFRVAPVAEDHAVTRFELFFDLVYVFAATQVVVFVVEEHSALALAQAALVLVLLWLSWVAYTWLGNQARADEGVIRGGMTVAMIGMFLVALAIPHAWEGREGGVSPALLLVAGYLLVRVVHSLLYLVAAQEDADLRRQIVLSTAPLSVSAVLLVVGAFLEGTGQLVAWTAALVVDAVGTYLTSRGGSWRISSPSHWTERFDLVMILVLGESVVAVGTGVGDSPFTGALLTGAALGLSLSVAMWWLYFDVVSLRGTKALTEGSEEERVALAIDGYTYLHFPLFAAVITVAFGVEEVIAHAGETEPLGLFSAVALMGGLALYLLAHTALWKRIDGVWAKPRLLTTLLLVAAVPLAATSPPLVALGGTLLVLVALLAFESTRYADVRRNLRRSDIAASK